MVLAQAVRTDRIRYVYHYDELTWMPDVLARPFNELKISYSMRPVLIKWLNEHTTGRIYIWPGMVSPQPNQSHWGHMVTPDEQTAFVIFAEESDQTRFSLEFVGSPDSITAVTHKDGVSAYYNRKR